MTGIIIAGVVVLLIWHQSKAVNPALTQVNTQPVFNKPVLTMAGPPGVQAATPQQEAAKVVQTTAGIVYQPATTIMPNFEGGPISKPPSGIVPMSNSDPQVPGSLLGNGQGMTNIFAPLVGSGAEMTVDQSVSSPAMTARLAPGTLSSMMLMSDSSLDDPVIPDDPVLVGVTTPLGGIQRGGTA